MQFSNLDSVLVQCGARVGMYLSEKQEQEHGPMANDFRKITHLLERRGNDTLLPSSCTGLVKLAG